MKWYNILLKVLSICLCGLTVLPLFMNFITLKNGDTVVSYNYASYSKYDGRGQVLMLVARILFVATIVIAAILVISLLLQMILRKDIINYFVIGASVIIIISATLGFVSVLLFGISISTIGKYVYFPAVGPYIMLFASLFAAGFALVSNIKFKKKEKNIK